MKFQFSKKKLSIKRFAQKLTLNFLICVATSDRIPTVKHSLHVNFAVLHFNPLFR